MRGKAKSGLIIATADAHAQYVLRSAWTRIHTQKYWPLRASHCLGGKRSLRIAEELIGPANAWRRTFNTLMVVLRQVPAHWQSCADYRVVTAKNRLAGFT